MGEVLVWEQVLFGLLALLVFAALGCQVLAMRHRRKEWLQFVHKDSLFRNKEMAYSETGMRYIRAQKKIAVVLVAVIVALAWINTPS